MQYGVWCSARGTGARCSGGWTITSFAPRTSTSGRRKCRRAAAQARLAQSRRLPASARAWIATRRCQTCLCFWLGEWGVKWVEREGERGEYAYALASEDAEGLAVYCVAPSEDFVEHPRQRDLLVTLPA